MSEFSKMTKEFESKVRLFVTAEQELKNFVNEYDEDFVKNLSNMPEKEVEYVKLLFTEISRIGREITSSYVPL